MDEIIIDEKKYISSKRAAKVTGYAKDYIGQLCREGRVQAQLVGRSWYVLESAIRDHRFGDNKTESETKPESISIDSTLKLQSTWESPRYEAATAEILPSINRLRNTDYKALYTPAETAQNEVNKTKPNEVLDVGVRSLGQEESLSSIPFDKKNSDHYEVTTLVADATPSVQIDETKNSLRIEDEGFNIPVHTVYELPPEVLLPRRVIESRFDPSDYHEAAEWKAAKKSSNVLRKILLVFKYITAVIAIIAAILGIVSTGYLDKFLASHNRATRITGVSTYIK